MIIRKAIIGFSVMMSVLCAHAKKPNIIMMMCDDLGYADVGFNGNPIIKTPHLDQMAKEGANLTQFYSIGPVCSPTRASFVTGRHYYRMGIWKANKGHLPQEEHTIARMFKAVGYTTGHFGKWHLGTLNTKISPKGKERQPKENYAPPWERDYDRSFVMESAVKTWEPTEGSQARNNPYYEDGVVTTENLRGDSSRIIMDRVIPFLEGAAKRDAPFLAVIWFNAPHKQIEAGPEYLKQYEGYGEAAHYFGCITAVDDQVGRLRAKLDELGIADNTIMTFTSDNGALGGQLKTKDEYARQKSRVAGYMGGFRGSKRHLLEGGVRVPSLILWPKMTKAGSRIDIPCSVLDYLPTLQHFLGLALPDDRPLDGQDILPVLNGEITTLDRAIPFRHASVNGDLAALVKGPYKLFIESPDNASGDKLYDLSKDQTESVNIIAKHPEIAQEMREEILHFLKSAKASHRGDDYGIPNYKPNEPWQALGATQLKSQPRGKNGIR